VTVSNNANALLTLDLGHGCGKLLQETSAGVFNFDVKNPPVSPLTGEPITTWYKPGQTWGSVFGGIAGAYEVLFS
jgi:dipeptidyl-peptidase III